ncbi:uncharacterized protein LOC122266866 [Penaeus japonicus]|uniref:uncharacterized protein LOC122266866 n=1 Tax=Penaeus japonicus TaxID=27405 RepID=UPI001C70E9DC|nr:uncharacterized protein LOC122266866 [Penaeus japonicus]
MKKINKARCACKGWLTRASEAIGDILAKPDVTLIELEHAIKQYDKRLEKFDEVQEEYESVVEDSALDQVLDDAHEFRTQCAKFRILAEAKVKELVAADAQDIVSQDSQAAVNVKLPKLELPKFSGDVIQWQSFWDQFISHIDATDIPVISKYAYLLSLLEGDAKNVVKGLAHTSANYQVACDLLKERYGRKERIIFTHVQALLNGKLSISTSSEKSVTQLWKLRDEILTHVRSLEALGVTGKQCEVFLTPIILSRLPHDLRLEWARDGDGHESDLDFLLDFLYKEISRLERSEAFRGKKNVAEGKTESSAPKEKKFSAAALHTSSKQEPPVCCFCKKKHKSENCFNVQKLSGQERGEKIRSLGVCFKCLNSGHSSRFCKAQIKCASCEGNHNTLMCGVKLDFSPRQEEVNKGQKSDNVTLMSSQGGSCTVLQTAKVKVCGTDGRIVTAKVLFDNGADRSYISSSFVKKCKPQWLTSNPIPYSSFGGHSAGKEELRNVFKISMLDKDNNVVPVITAEIPKICQPLVRPVVPNHVLNSFSHVELADDYNSASPMVIDVLIGLDYYWTLISAADAIQKECVVAMRSIFGYVLSGRLPDSAHTTSRYSETQLLCISPLSDSDLCKFWDLETVGIKPKEVVQDNSDSKVMQEFKNTVQFKADRYEVALPWKNDSVKEKLINNESIARRRLNRLQVKLDKDKELKKDYLKVLASYEDENIIEEVPSNEISNVNPVYYMPHRPVIKLNSSSTKIRPVFDASASCFNGVSLNDCLHSGPSLNPDLVEVLVRFCRWPIAITADIKKAFLQINVRKEDKDVHRFLLPKEDGTIRHMRFNRVPFGNTSSPFLLNATLKTHLAKYPQSKVVQELKTDMYTDNWLSGADSVKDAHDKFCDARSILADCSMDLTKLVSNCMSITSKSKDGVYHIHDGDESSSVLGLRWCNVQDTFSFDCRKPDDSVEVSHTKRSILSIIAKMFDPLGLISPFIMYGKILFQEVWKLKLDWDEELPLELKVKFQKWIHSSQSLNAFHVDRSYFPGMLWGDLKDNIELHGFGDASEKGYGACVYLRVPVDNSSFKVSLVMSKSRVAPIKALTLPRLELMGALLCSRLVNFVKNSLHLDSRTKVMCWSDSTIALSWIKGDLSKKDIFVANRVKEIKEFTSPECWQHCPSEENPADIITRGVLADKLVHNSQWLYGPPMLASVLCHDKEDVKQGLDLEVPCTTSVPICLSVQVTHSPLIDLEKFSDLEKALRVTAYVLRFIDNCKGRKVQGPLTAEEIELASLKLIYNIQQEAFANEIRLLSSNKTLPLSSKLRKLDPFIDDKGLLRIKGRLEFSELDYDTKHPFIIPKGKYAKLLIKFQHKYLKHAGVDSVISSIRTQFWIISVRKLAKTIVKECLICRWLDSRPCSQPVAPLPKERITTARPFSVTGLDYAGPLFCADFPDKKFYVLLFTCGVVRAIHLELTESLSLYDCMLAIRKFVARRGLPNVIFSDNAKTFMAAKSEAVDMYGHLAPKWKFIVPRSPWWGGWWERLIRSVKLALRKTLGLNYISVRELETVLVEIEGCINSRPLTYVSEDPDPLHYLTPSHFILGCNPHSKPSVEIVSCNVNAKDLNERAIVQNVKLEHFWKVWSNNYITNLPKIVNGFTQNCKLSKGDLVLIKEDNIPRLKWPIGVIVDIFPGKDGIIRSIKVKTKKGEVIRPIQRAYDLEISKHENMSAPDELAKFDDVSSVM